MTSPTSNLAAVSIASQEIRAALRADGRFFIEFFLAEELTSPVPDFHLYVWNKLIDVEMPKVLLALPRGHAKTTLAKLACVWLFLFSHFRFCTYVSNTSRFAKNACLDILRFLQSKNFISTFGHIEIEKESETEGLWIFKMPLGDGRIKRCILRAAGAGQQTRGLNVDNRRPDFGVLDDIEDRENIATPELRMKLRTWAMGTFMKAMNPQYSKVIWIGNMLSSDCLLNSLAGMEEWNPTVLGAIIRDERTNQLMPLWPDLWTAESLQQDFMQYKTLGLADVWMAEMMNLPEQAVNGFSVRDINYQPTPVVDELTAAFLTIDPAFGMSAKHHDSTAIVAHGIDTDGLTHILEMTSGHYTEPEIFHIASDMAQRWKAWTWGIEAIAAQRVLLTLFTMYATRDQMDGIYRFVPIINGANTTKIGRIRAWVASMKRIPEQGIEPTYAIPEDDIDITSCILRFDPNKKDQKDDVIDACSMGLNMLSNYYSEICEAAAVVQGIARPKPQIGLEVSGV